MWKTITTIILGKQNRAEERLIEGNATIIIEQKLREATSGHETAKRTLAALLARTKADQRLLDGVENRIRDLEARTRKAIEEGKDALAQDAAQVLADLENERTVRREALTRAEEKAARMRLAVERTERQLIDLKQGLITAKAIESERSSMKAIKGDLSANSAIREGEAVLQRLLASDDPVEEIEALEELEASLKGDNVVDRLAAEGCGPATKVRAEDILQRLGGATAPATS
ncbi:MAG: PspA/IM30 family protein [Pseudomonadota bacterium]